ncbi:hypothetical protein E8E13_007714 [Curvularia kusanoi]|uniref:Uncharacterized protein n=1 Tax=Curvularia kusanoi TaxID=90978 RepID=A0A9P4TA88_CURKU|nr:hypothetical protein E8E13_007714 [Curvularia kusanoi]
MSDPILHSQPEPFEPHEGSEEELEDYETDDFAQAYYNQPDPESTSTGASIATLSEHHDYDPQISNLEELDTRDEGIEDADTSDDSTEDEERAEQRQVLTQLIIESRDTNTRTAYDVRIRIERQINILNILNAKRLGVAHQAKIEAIIRRRANLIHISVLHFNRAMFDHSDMERDEYDLDAKQLIAGGVESGLKNAKKGIIKAEQLDGSSEEAAADGTNDMSEISFKAKAFLDACGFTVKRKTKSNKQDSDTKEHEPGREGPLVGEFPER